MAFSGGWTIDTDPPLTPPLDTSGFNPPGDSDIIMQNVSDTAFSDPNELDDGGTGYSIQSISVAIDGPVRFTTYGFGSAPGTTTDIRFIGSLEASAEYNGTHHLSTNKIDGTIYCEQPFFYFVWVFDVDLGILVPSAPILGTLICTGVFEAEVERIKSVDVSSYPPNEPFVKTFSLNATGDEIIVDPVIICAESPIHFDAHSEFGMHPELTEWKVLKNGVQVGGGTGQGFDFTFDEASQNVDEYIIETTPCDDRSVFSSQIVAVVPDLVKLQYSSDGFGPEEIPQGGDDILIEEPAVVLVEGETKWSGIDGMPDTADDRLCLTRWDIQILHLSHNGAVEVRPDLATGRSAEIEFISVDPQTPDELPDGFICVFYIAPEHPGINVFYIVTVSKSGNVKKPNVNMQIDPESVFGSYEPGEANQSVTQTFTAQIINHTNEDPSNIGFTTTARYGNAAQVGPRANVPPDSATQQYTFNSPGRWIIEAEHNMAPYAYASAHASLVTLNHVDNILLNQNNVFFSGQVVEWNFVFDNPAMFADPFPFLYGFYEAELEVVGDQIFELIPGEPESAFTRIIEANGEVRFKFNVGQLQPGSVTTVNVNVNWVRSTLSNGQITFLRLTDRCTTFSASDYRLDRIEVKNQNDNNFSTDNHAYNFYGSSIAPVQFRAIFTPNTPPASALGSLTWNVSEIVGGDTVFGNSLVPPPNPPASSANFDDINSVTPNLITATGGRFRVSANWGSDESNEIKVIIFALSGVKAESVDTQNSRNIIVEDLQPGIEIPRNTGVEVYPGAASLNNDRFELSLVSNPSKVSMEEWTEINNVSQVTIFSSETGQDFLSFNQVSNHFPPLYESVIQTNGIGNFAAGRGTVANRNQAPFQIDFASLVVEVIIEGIRFNHNDNSSANDAIGVIQTKELELPGNEIGQPAWIPAHESTTDKQDSRNYEFRTVAVPPSDPTRDFQVGLSNFERYSDSPALYKIGVQSPAVKTDLAFPKANKNGVQNFINDHIEMLLRDNSLGLTGRRGNWTLRIEASATGSQVFDIDATVFSLRYYGNSNREKNFVSMPLVPKAALSSINRYNTTFDWSFKCGGVDSRSGLISFVMPRPSNAPLIPASTRHRIYLIKAEPVKPWKISSDQDFAGHRPYTEILDLACELFAGLSDEREILTKLERWLQSMDVDGPAVGLNIVYDGGEQQFFSTGAGAAGAWNGVSNPFDIQGYFDSYINPVNHQVLQDSKKKLRASCYDQAGAFALISRIVGIDSKMIWASPYIPTNKLRQLYLFGDRDSNQQRRRFWHDDPATPPPLDEEFTRERAFTLHAYNVTGTLQSFNFKGTSSQAGEEYRQVIGDGWSYDPLCRYGNFLHDFGTRSAGEPGTFLKPDPQNPGGTIPTPYQLTNDILFWRWAIDDTLLGLPGDDDAAREVDMIAQLKKVGAGVTNDVVPGTYGFTNIGIN
ncbi:MAG: hypothetical protein NUW37_06630 [Planctomycetes bacterium]|nr:hypothetical protein [Planctomycetota bacterium]